MKENQNILKREIRNVKVAPLLPCVCGRAHIDRDRKIETANISFHLYDWSIGSVLLYWIQIYFETLNFWYKLVWNSKINVWKTNINACLLKAILHINTGFTWFFDDRSNLLCIHRILNFDLIIVDNWRNSQIAHDLQFCSKLFSS